MATAIVDPNDHDVFLLRQRIRPVVNQYEFSLPDGDGDGDGEAGPAICFVEQKRFKFKEDIRFCTDDSKQAELMRIKARQRFDPRARYDVTDSAGSKVGEIQKAFGESLLRSTYRFYDAHGNEVAKAHEKSLTIALVRRLVGASSPTSATSPTGCRSRTTSTSSATAGCSGRTRGTPGRSVTSTRSTRPATLGGRSTAGSSSRSRSGWTRCRHAERDVQRPAAMSARGGWNRHRPARARDRAPSLPGADRGVALRTGRGRRRR